MDQVSGYAHEIVSILGKIGTTILRYVTLTTHQNVIIINIGTYAFPIPLNIPLIIWEKASKQENAAHILALLTPKNITLVSSLKNVIKSGMKM